MKKILAINGSLRANSSNGLLLNALENVFKESEFSIYDSLSNLPHFNPDLDPSDAVIELKDRVNASDYLLIVTPEYAHGVPGVLKNALDWLVSDERLPGKEVIIFVCSTGDGTHAFDSLIEILKTMSLSVSANRCFNFNSIRSRFSKGELVDQELKLALERLVLTCATE